MILHHFRFILVIGFVAIFACDLGDLNESKPPPYFETEYTPPEPEPEPEPIIDPNNIITNGGFELSIAGWRFDTSPPAITKFSQSDTSYLGNHSLHAKIDQLGPYDWWINMVWNPLVLEEGVSYRISLWAKSTTVDPEFQMAVSMNHEPWEWYESIVCNPQEAWEHFYFDFTAGVSVSDGSHFIINFNSVGEYWIDEVWIQKHVEDE